MLLLDISTQGTALRRTYITLGKEDFVRVLLSTHIAVAADSAHVEVAHSRGGLSLRTAARARTGLIVTEAARASSAGWLKCSMDQHGTPSR